jgi:cytoskeletal protein CcmA (bactofilin family)
MFGSKRPPSPKEIGSLVGAGSIVRGDVMFNCGMRIDGKVVGNVHCAEGEKGGMLVISEHGSVEGEVRAAHLVVAGSIVGPVYAGEMVELQPKARILGDLHYRALEMHHGAVVEGRLIHESAASRPPAPLKLAAVSATPVVVLEDKSGAATG